MLHCADPCDGDKAELRLSGSNKLEQGATVRLKTWQEA
jgi:hypothetical protein